MTATKSSGKKKHEICRVKDIGRISLDFSPDFLLKIADAYIGKILFPAYMTAVLMVVQPCIF